MTVVCTDLRSAQVNLIPEAKVVHKAHATKGKNAQKSYSVL